MRFFPKKEGACYSAHAPQNFSGRETPRPLAAEAAAEGLQQIADLVEAAVLKGIAHSFYLLMYFPCGIL